MSNVYKLYISTNSKVEFELEEDLKNAKKRPFFLYKKDDRSYEFLKVRSCSKKIQKRMQIKTYENEYLLLTPYTNCFKKASVIDLKEVILLKGFEQLDDKYFWYCQDQNCSEFNAKMNVDQIDEIYQKVVEKRKKVLEQNKQLPETGDHKKLIYTKEISWNLLLFFQEWEERWVKTI